MPNATVSSSRQHDSFAGGHLLPSTSKAAPAATVERFKNDCCRLRTIFFVLASFRLSHRPLRACSFAKASPEPKSPRSEQPHYFLNALAHRHKVVMVEKNEREVLASFFWIFLPEKLRTGFQFLGLRSASEDFLVSARYERLIVF